MSGIVCLFDRAGNGVDQAEVEAMLETIDHRGPDGKEIWCDDRIGLGHQQLQTTPESRFDHQPYRDGDTVITADARIDNREELLETLSFREEPTRIPDSQFILKAYQRWGDECVDHLVGAFVFVIWDDDEQRVFCGRDFFGVKPLYYYRDDEFFAVASEPKALLALPFVPADINQTKIGDFLIKNFEDKESTFFESILRLPPAHALTVDATAADMWQFWELDPTRTIELESDAAYERRFRELFEQAVECRLRATGPVGTTLSGGIDSSSITVMAREVMSPDESLHTFSNVYDESPTSNEREYIETVTSRNGIEPHYIISDGLGVLHEKEEVLSYFDQPLINNMHFSRWERAKQAQEAGVRVMLGGAIGDQAIGYGLGLLPQLFLRGRWVHLRREIRAMSDVLDTSEWYMFRRHVLRHVVPDPVLRVRSRLKGEPVLLDKGNPILNPEFVETLGLRERYREFQTDLGVVWSDRRDNYKALQGGRKPALFESSDQTMSVFGVEPRYPFTDKRLVEFTLAIPPTQQFSEGWTRSIARRALGDLLPEKIQWRTWKTPMDEAFKKALGEEADMFEALFADPGPLTTYFDMSALNDSYERFSSQQQNRDARRLWEALSLWAWLTKEDCVHTN